MATVTIRPNGTVTAGTNITVTGAATQHAALSDQNNSTYIGRTGVQSATSSKYDMAAAGITAGTISRIRCGGYNFSNNNASASLSIGLSTLTGTHFGFDFNYSASGTTPNWTYSNWFTARPAVGGGSWTIADLDNLQLIADWDAQGSASGTTRLVEATIEIDYYRPPAAPTNVVPAQGATVKKPNPEVSCTLQASGDGQKQQAEWQFATDAAFTQNVVTLGEGPDDYEVQGPTSETPNTQELSLGAGTWYVRARGKDEFGVYGPWSSTNSFNVTHSVGTINQQPTGGATVAYAATNRLTWNFSGPTNNSVQSAYRVVVEKNSDGTQILDTGKVVSTNKFADVAIGAANKDIELRWKVQVWDGGDSTTGYSNYHLFYVSDVPTVTITAPAEAGTVTTGNPTITWSVDAGTTQASRTISIKRSSDNVVVFTNSATTSSQTFTPPTTILQNGVSYVVTVSVTDIVGLTGSDSNTFSTSYTAPPDVTYSVNATDIDNVGYILIDWSQMTPDAQWLSWKLYRRISGSDTWDLLATYTNVNTRTYKDWMVTAGDEYEYAVTQTANRSGESIESVINPFPIPHEAATTHYWLISPYDENDSMRIDLVSSDSYTDSYDEAELILIGRGRKMNHGTRHGYSGSLVAQLRDDSVMTARQKRMKLQIIKEQRTAYYLRNPFGDILLVSMGNLSIERIAGVSTREFVDVTIPYVEVF